MKQTLKRLSAALFALMLSSGAFALDSMLRDITITQLRAVGDYNGTTFDDTLEIHFNQPVSFESGSRCTATHRVFIDARNRHLVAMAYLAFSSGKRVHINVDDTLPIRAGACQVSFLDVLP